MRVLHLAMAAATEFRTGHFKSARRWCHKFHDGRIAIAFGDLHVDLQRRHSKSVHDVFGSDHEANWLASRHLDDRGFEPELAGDHLHLVHGTMDRRRGCQEHGRRCHGAAESRHRWIAHGQATTMRPVIFGCSEQ